MLEEMLHEIRNGGALDASRLAARLGTSPAMVHAMLEHLQRLGYIQPYGEACGEGCGGCSLSPACDHTHKMTIWKYQG